MEFERLNYRCLLVFNSLRYIFVTFSMHSNFVSTTRASMARVLITLPCISGSLWVKVKYLPLKSIRILKKGLLSTTVFLTGRSHHYHIIVSLQIHSMNAIIATNHRSLEKPITISGATHYTILWRVISFKNKPLQCIKIHTFRCIIKESMYHTKTWLYIYMTEYKDIHLRFQMPK